MTAGLIRGILMLNLFRCFSPKPTYAVNYDGRKDCFEGAKDRYAAGKTVTVNEHLQIRIKS